MQVWHIRVSNIIMLVKNSNAKKRRLTLAEVMIANMMLIILVAGLPCIPDVGKIRVNSNRIRHYFSKSESS